MVHEFLEIYEQRIRGLDWMSEATKEKAVEKLHSMSIKVGYPDDDDWDDSMDAVDIKSVAEGGSYFANMVEIARVTREYLIDMQGKPVDKSIWAMNVYTVNACYIAQFNEIVFPAGILRAPMYDVNNTREQNLGGIGYIIAHEITHAFDNNGAKFGKDGNAEDWWTAEDYAAFQKLCSRVVAHYDGAEGSNGVACKGELTLSENIADLGAAACVTEAAKRMENPDFKQLFETMARSWESTATRSTRQYVAQVDVHAPDKLRVNRVLVNLPEFYEAFDIGPGDGMYVADAIISRCFMVFWMLAQGFPGFGFEAGVDAFLADQQRAFDQHPIRCEERKLFVLAHVGEAVFEVQGAVLDAARVEEAFEREAAHGVPAAELFFGWVVFFNIAEAGFDAVLCKPCLRFFAG